MVWSALDISQMKPGFERVVDCPVYWSGVKRKGTCGLAGSRIGETGRDGDVDKEPKVDYTVPFRPTRMVIVLRGSANRIFGQVHVICHGRVRPGLDFVGVDNQPARKIARVIFPPAKIDQGSRGHDSCNKSS